MIGNTREQLFHVRRSFNFNENTETLDANVMCIRLVAALLGYDKPQIVLDTDSKRRYKICSRKSYKNTYKRNDR